jgi:hypothetical protein
LLLSHVGGILHNIVIFCGEDGSRFNGGVRGLVPSVDGGWPRASTTASGARLVIYQPQIASWVDQRDMVIYAAIAYTPAGASKAALGTIRAESATSVSTASWAVSLADLRITETNFSTSSRTWSGRWPRTSWPPQPEIACSRSIACSPTSTRPDHPEERGRREADPPPIFFSRRLGQFGNLMATRSGPHPRQ